MKYLKGFGELLEARFSNLSATPEEIKQMPEYQKLLKDFDLEDHTSPTIAKSKNIRLLDKKTNKSYTICISGCL